MTSGCFTSHIRGNSEMKIITYLTETGADFLLEQKRNTSILPVGRFDFCRYRPAQIKFLLLFPFPRKGSDQNCPIIGIRPLCPVLNLYTI
jgi:hypothetical protein